LYKKLQIKLFDLLSVWFITSKYSTRVLSSIHVYIVPFITCTKETHAILSVSGFCMFIHLHLALLSLRFCRKVFKMLVHAWKESLVALHGYGYGVLTNNFSLWVPWIDSEDSLCSLQPSPTSLLCWFAAINSRMFTFQTQNNPRANQLLFY